MSRRLLIDSKTKKQSTQNHVGYHLHLDAFSGISGNMFLGALFDLGLSQRALTAELAGLDLAYRLRVSRVHRGAIAARYVEVRCSQSDVKKRSAQFVPTVHKLKLNHSDRHSAVGALPAARHQKHSKSTHHGATGRMYRDIRALIERAKLRETIRARALTIFEFLANAEAKVHGVKPEAVHFHEVGAVDAIVDVVAAAAGIELLGVRRVTCSPVALGHGTVVTEHGFLPLPAPATLELLRGMPTRPAQVAWEAVTPTGAAILRALVDEFVTLPVMTLESIGYGAGDDRSGSLPNVLRAMIGKNNTFLSDKIICMETNLDDFIPEHFEYLMEQLFSNGALDVSVQTLQMKKNRPGFLLRVLAKPQDRALLAQTLFAESTALGVRFVEMDRLLLQREVVAIATPYGKIRIKKVVTQNGVECSAEYEDCKRAAQKCNVSLRKVVREVEMLACKELA